MKIYYGRRQFDEPKEFFDNLIGKDVWVKIQMFKDDEPSYIRLIGKDSGGFIFNEFPAWLIDNCNQWKFEEYVLRNHIFDDETVEDIILDRMERPYQYDLKYYYPTKPLDIRSTEELFNVLRPYYDTVNLNYRSEE